jgi:hypothetical protein
MGLRVLGVMFRVLGFKGEAEVDLTVHLRQGTRCKGWGV